MPDDKVKIKDTRSHIPATKRLHSEIGMDRLNSIITESVNEDVNPYTALSIAMKESRMGESRADYGVDHYAPLLEAKPSEQDALLNEVTSWSPEKLFVKALKNKMGYAKRLGYDDELNQIQAFNGLGYNPEYGVNMKRNPMYAKEIIDIRENVMNQNTTVNDLIGEAINKSMLNKLQQGYSDDIQPFNF